VAGNTVPIGNTRSRLASKYTNSARPSCYSPAL